MSIRELALGASLFLGPSWGCQPATSGPPAATPESKAEVSPADPSSPGAANEEPNPTGPDTSNGAPRSTAEYVRLGVPSPSRRWTKTEYAEAATALEKLAANTPGSLPLRDSEVFRRLVAHENLNPLKDTSATLRQRLLAGSGIMGALSKVSALYLAGIKSEKPLMGELLAVLAYSIRAAVLMAPLLNEVEISLDKNDPMLDRRLAGITKTRKGLRGLVSGTVTMLSARSEYTDEFYMWILGKFQDPLPRAITYLDEATRKEILKRLEAMAEAERHAPAREQLERMLRSPTHAPHP